MSVVIDKITYVEARLHAENSIEDKTAKRWGETREKIETLLRTSTEVKYPRK